MALSELLLEAILVLFLSLFFSPPISFIPFGFLQQTLLCCFAHSLVPDFANQKRGGLGGSLLLL
jgi:hypothetical protein